MLSHVLAEGLPVTLPEGVESKLVGYFSSIHCIRKILFVSKNKQHSIPKLILRHIGRTKVKPNSKYHLVLYALSGQMNNGRQISENKIKKGGVTSKENLDCDFHVHFSYILPPHTYFSSVLFKQQWTHTRTLWSEKLSKVL